MIRSSITLACLLLASACFNPDDPAAETDDGSSSGSTSASTSVDPSVSSTSSGTTAVDSTTSEGDSSTTAPATTGESSGSSGGDPCEGLVCGEVAGMQCGSCQLGDCIDNVACCTSPSQASIIAVPGDVRGLSVSGNVLYAAAYGEGLQTVDISNIAAPTSLGSLGLSSYAWDVDVSGGRAYVAWAYSGLVVVDVANPSAPMDLGAELAAGGTGVAFDGNYAYVAGGASYSLYVVNVANASAPALVGTAPLTTQATRVTVAAGRAFVPVEDGTLAIVDISDPADPFQSATFDAAGVPFDVVVNGTTAYVAEGYYGVEILDVSQPDNPQLLGSFELMDNSGQIRGVALSGQTLVVGHGGATSFLDVGDPSAPFLIGAVPSPSGAAASVAISGNHAFVAAGTGGVQVIQLPECGT